MFRPIWKDKDGASYCYYNHQRICSIIYNLEEEYLLIIKEKIVATFDNLQAAKSYFNKQYYQTPNTVSMADFLDIKNDYYLDLLDIIEENNKSKITNHIDNLRTEFIRLKAIEQAAKDFVKSDNVIENIEDLSYSNLKELLQVD